LILSRKSELLALANEVAAGLVRRGGGCKDLQVRLVDRGESSAMMVVVHVLCDPCDAMGANIINQVCEALRVPIEILTDENVTMCILSNLVDTRLTEATVTLEGIEADLALKIEEGSLFGELDPYRAATNNKGVLNGIDAVLIATGNDWRAVEAGVHAYAAQSGRYKSITKWRADGRTLRGTLTAPLVAGTVGGVTTLHPTARLNMRMLKVSSAEQLSRILAAVGLVQNLGALRALTTVGVVEGHMKLHAANLAMAAGARPEEMPSVQALLEAFLKRERRVSLQNAVEVLEQVRTRQIEAHETSHPE
jgi:hydroxymethylglutaryl-CoA reductase